MMNTKPEKRLLTLPDAARRALDAYDQANTSQAIDRLGSRGRILSEIMEDLRNVANGQKVEYYEMVWAEALSPAGGREENQQPRNQDGNTNTDG
jgi:hypothetical protein